MPGGPPVPAGALRGALGIRRGPQRGTRPGGLRPTAPRPTGPPRPAGAAVKPGGAAVTTPQGASGTASSQPVNPYANGFAGDWQSAATQNLNARTANQVEDQNAQMAQQLGGAYRETLRRMAEQEPKVEANTTAKANQQGTFYSSRLGEGLADNQRAYTQKVADQTRGYQSNLDKLAQSTAAARLAQQSNDLNALGSAADRTEAALSSAASQSALAPDTSAADQQAQATTAVGALAHARAQPRFQSFTRGGHVYHRDIGPDGRVTRVVRVR